MGTDVRYSGSTCVSVMTYGRHLFIANVGDSRAIIVKQDPADSKRKFKSHLDTEWCLTLFLNFYVCRLHCEGIDSWPQAWWSDWVSSHYRRRRKNWLISWQLRQQSWTWARLAQAWRHPRPGYEQIFWRPSGVSCRSQRSSWDIRAQNGFARQDYHIG